MDEDDSASEPVMLNRVLGAPAMESWMALVARTGFWAFLIYYSQPLFNLRMHELNHHWGFLHGVNLIFHEAGHVFFGLFGNELLMFLGGTFGQLLMPLVLALAFYFKNKDCYATGIFVWWVGENLVDCAPYINDARALQLQLLGGGTGKEVHGHDWENIFTILDMLDQDIYIARDVLLAGRIVMAIGLLWMFAILIRQLMLCLNKKRRAYPAQ